MSPFPVLTLALTAALGAPGGEVITTRFARVEPNAGHTRGEVLTLYAYDQLNRLARASDNLGQTTYFTYDSRDNLIQKRDPVGAPTADPLGLFPGTINAEVFQNSADMR